MSASVREKRVEQVSTTGTATATGKGNRQIPDIDAQQTNIHEAIALRVRPGRCPNGDTVGLSVISRSLDRRGGQVGSRSDNKPPVGRSFLARRVASAKLVPRRSRARATTLPACIWIARRGSRMSRK